MQGDLKEYDMEGGEAVPPLDEDAIHEWREGHVRNVGRALEDDVQLDG